MPATFTIPLITVIPGQLITASLWNNEYGNIYDNFEPAGMDDYSTNDTEMQTTTDPFPASTTSRPTSLQGELERLRYVIAQLSGESFWYVDPDVDIATFKTRFDAHTHDGTTNNGPQIGTGGIAALAVTNPKIADDAITTRNYADASISTAKIGDSQVTTAKIADNAVSTAKIGDSQITTAKINADAVNGSKIADDSIDSEHYVDASIDVAHLSAEVLARMSPKTIQRFSTVISFTVGSDTTAIVQGTANQTITSVDTSKSVLLVGGARIASNAGTGLGGISWSARLTSATNVALAVTIASPTTNVSIDVTIDFEVLEFN